MKVPKERLKIMKNLENPVSHIIIKVDVFEINDGEYLQ
jgi:hypothetical protein